jgi:hypothetical protein
MPDDSPVVGGGYWNNGNEIHISLSERSHDDDIKATLAHELWHLYSHVTGFWDKASALGEQARKLVDAIPYQRKQELERFVRARWGDSFGAFDDKGIDEMFADALANLVLGRPSSWERIEDITDNAMENFIYEKVGQNNHKKTADRGTVYYVNGSPYETYEQQQSVLKGMGIDTGGRPRGEQDGVRWHWRSVQRDTINVNDWRLVYGQSSGLRKSIKSLLTGTTVGIYKAEDAYLDPTGGKWVLICEEHDTYVNVRTMKDALEWAAHPEEWCEVCQSQDRTAANLNDSFEDRLGNCFELAVKYAISIESDTDKCDARVVHGSIQGGGNPRIAHAWVEYTDKDLARQMIEKMGVPKDMANKNARVAHDPVADLTLPIEAHEAMFSAITEYVYTVDEARRNAFGKGHWGPWDELRY